MGHDVLKYPKKFSPNEAEARQQGKAGTVLEDEQGWIIGIRIKEAGAMQGCKGLQKSLRGKL